MHELHRALAPAGFHQRVQSGATLKTYPARATHCRDDGERVLRDSIVGRVVCVDEVCSARAYYRAISYCPRTATRAAPDLLVRPGWRFLRRAKYAGSGVRGWGDCARAFRRGKAVA
jgi:hypothetical protein